MFDSDEMGCVVTTLIGIGIVSAVLFTYEGFIMALIIAACLSVMALGLFRFFSFKSGSDFTVFDVIGILAGAFLTGWIWASDSFIPRIFYKLLWHLSKDKEIPGFFLLVWGFGGGGLFVYSLIAVFIPKLKSLSHRLQGPPKFRPYAENFGAGKGEDYFNFDPGNFFDDEDPEPEPPEFEPEKIGYFKIPKRYSAREAVRMYQISGVDHHPGHTETASALKACCFSALGLEKGRDFVGKAARDETLPKKIRQLYIHAEQIILRSSQKS